MKIKFAFIFCFIFFQISISQNIEKYQFEYTSISLKEFLKEVEKSFNIKYTYIDITIEGKKIQLPKRFYTLEKIHSIIEKITKLKITKIDNRFYAVSSNKKNEFTYLLSEIFIESLLTNGIYKTSKSVVVNPQKVKILPGVTDADVLRSLQQLPSVKSPNETATGLNVRGGTSDQNLILWDGIKLYHPGHLFGMVSGFNPNIEQKVNFHYKGVNPKFGKHLSSVIDIKTTNNISKKISTGFNALNGDVYIKAPLIKDKLGIQIAARKSFTEEFQTSTFEQLSNKVFQNTNFTNFNDKNHFKFQDYFLKVNFKASDKTNFFLSNILIENSLKFNTIDETESNTLQEMKILNYGFSFNWSQKYNSKLNQLPRLFGIIFEILCAHSLY